MKSIILILFFSLLYFSTKSQTINNVVAKQDGDNVVITYNLQCIGDADISLSVSEDGGSTFKGPLKSVSGDVGIGVKPGNKIIIWNTLKDQEMIVGDNIVFRIVYTKFGKFIDSRDGKTYKTVKIGTQIWMAENLAYKATDGCWAYDNNESNIAIYGYLYDWQTAKNVCPTGWHLPSRSEFDELFQNVGGVGLNAYYALKTVGSSGFNSSYGGWRNNNGEYKYLGLDVHYWSSSMKESNASWYIYVNSNSTPLGADFGSNPVLEWGFSVRCVRD